jgi:uncharacterized protein YceK
MQRIKYLNLTRLIFVCLPILLMSGCGVTILQPGFTTQVASSYQGASIQVDLVGVNNSELAAWNAKPIDDYFAAGDMFRGSAPKVTLNFGSDQAGTQTLASSNPIWKQWKSKSATYVMVIADLPGYTVPMGGVDLRRQVVPLSSDRWTKSPPEISIQVTPTGIILVPAPKAE